MSVQTSAQTNQSREAFFQLLFGDESGYFFLGLLAPTTKAMREEWFEYPREMPRILEAINVGLIGHNVYFCPQLFAAKRRIKENARPCTNIWADLDGCPPDKLLVKPTVLLETSPDRWQAFWSLDKMLEPTEAEDIARRIAYFHAKDGADRTGWDLTQLLRVPLTYNYKYATGSIHPPVVRPAHAGQTRYRTSDFKDYPEAAGFEYLKIPMPEVLVDEDASKVLERHKNRLLPQVWHLFNTVPTKSWSEPLWQLEMVLFESGLTREEVFVVVQEAACNKYKRDNRNIKFLWQEVCRAWSKVEERNHRYIPPSADLQQLLTDEERRWVEATPSFVERYIEWASSLGDAAWQYHQAGAFITLSSLLAGSVKLPTSYGTIVPNLWFMILADTTLTRKSTAMDIATDLVMELDSDAVLATDGSIEGLLTSMSTRPGRPSIFLRDEFSGLLEQMTKKDYMAGMAELLTKLYDGKFQKRMLRKEIIEVRDPILIVFAGGIRSRITQQLSYEHVTSGFMPRFCFITAESDVSRLKPLGPPTETDLAGRAAIISELRDMVEYYKPQPVEVSRTLGRLSIPKSQHTEAHLTTGAWQLYNKFEADLVLQGVQSQQPDMMTPVYDRLSKSGLKAAILLAASRQRAEKVEVAEEDIIRAFYYVDVWRVFAHEILNSVGKSSNEKELEKLFNAIKKHPGITRSRLMQNYHLTSREADQLFRTLEERGLITVSRSGRTSQYHATA